MSVPLNQWPIIMTHDAGTSYLNSGTCSIRHEVNNWAQTQQTGPFSKHLDCGARALDLRMYVKDGHLVMHHAAIVIPHDFVDALNDVKSWVAKQPDELVLLYSSHCDGKTDSDKSSCADKVHAAYKTAGIAELDCSKLAGLTMGEAMQQGKFSSTAGSVVALVNCGVEENYDPSIKCYGDWTREQGESALAPAHATIRGAANATRPQDIFWCYGRGADKAFDALWGYMSSLCDGATPPHAADGQLWMAQAHWQTDTSSISQGVVHSSCILEDESNAGVNKKLAQRIQQGSFKHINILEVDNVCDGGQELLQALRSRAVAAPFDVVVV